MRDESLDDFAQRGQRFVDRNAFLRAISGRFGLFQSLTAGQIHKVDLAAQSALGFGHFADCDGKDGVAATRLLVHFGSADSTRFAPFAENTEHFRASVHSALGKALHNNIVAVINNRKTLISVVEQVKHFLVIYLGKSIFLTFNKDENDA